MRPVDTLIIGQGLAGTAVAWELIRRGSDFVIADASEPSTCSRVAAGLITPVAGTRFTLAEHFTTLLEIAKAAYGDAQRRLGTKFFLKQPAVRLLYCDDEVRRFERRSARLLDSGFAELIPTSRAGYVPARLSIRMPHAARLDTRTYLDASRRYFEQNGCMVSARVDLKSLRIEPDRVLSETLKVRAKQVVFCGGYRDATNPWLPDNAFNCAQGEILSVRIAGLGESRTVHARKSWLCPAGQPDSYLFGSTYQHAPFEEATTPDAREALCQRLGTIVELPFSVQGQRYGIRPISVGRRAIVGRSARAPSVAWLNGLGSKGALLAPYLASCLVDSLVSNAAPDIRLTRAWPPDTAANTSGWSGA